MKKISWLLLLLIIFVWFAIATYWTGKDDSSQKSTPESPQITSMPSAPSSPSPSPELSPAPISTSSVNIELKY